MPKTLKFMVTGSGLFLLLLVASGAYLVWESLPYPPDSALPLLVRDLPGRSPKEADKAFRERVRKKFPDGMPVQDLASELRREGFELHEMPKGIARESILYSLFEHATIDQQGGLWACPKSWSITWLFDQGHAAQINAYYRVNCPRFDS